MDLIVFDTKSEANAYVADLIVQEINKYAFLTLGLATGETPKGIYSDLIKRYRENKVSFKNITTFNLDEYIGLHPQSPDSYHFYMQEKLFNHIDCPKENIHIPNGCAEDLNNECGNYEKLIEESGGIDLQLLGIGTNGHIGFNEPGTAFDTHTHITKLAPSTIEANTPLLVEEKKLPSHALSMGLKTIRQTKKIILVAFGKQKADAIQRLLNGEVSEGFPASILKKHSDIKIVIDSELNNELKVE